MWFVHEMSQSTNGNLTICIHMITLGSPCKRHEVLVRVGMTQIAKQEDLPRVGMTRIGKQEVMARVGRTRIVMHGRLPETKYSTVCIKLSRGGVNRFYAYYPIFRDSQNYEITPK